MSLFTRKRILLFLTGSVLFVSFILFSYIVHKDLLTQFDFDTTVRLQDRIPRRVDTIFSYFSLFGNFEVVCFILVILLLSLRKVWGIIAFCLFGLFHIIEIFGKYMVNHPPPPRFLLRTEHPVDLPQFYVSAEYSYPSGHSGRMLFMLSLLLLIIWNSKRLSKLWKSLLTALLLSYTAIMLVSRVYLGEHWSSDVIGGGLLGLSLGILGSIFLLPIKRPHNAS